MDINPTLSVITLSVNGLNTSIKKTKIGRMDILKTWANYILSIRHSFQNNDIRRFKVL